MEKDEVSKLLLVIIKKLNFIEILETICVKIKDGAEIYLSSSDISASIEEYLTSKGIEGSIKEHFMVLANALLGFLDYPELLTRELASMFIVISGLRKDFTNLFAEFLNLLHKSPNHVHKLTFLSVARVKQRYNFL